MNTITISSKRNQLIFICLILLSSTVFVYADDWPNWRGPSYNGISNETSWNPVIVDNKANILWEASVGVGFSSISVSDGKVYSAGNLDDRDFIFCFDADSGNKLWMHAYEEDKNPKYYEGGTSATVTISDGKAYFISRTGDVFCLNADDGSVVWTKNFRKEYDIAIPTWGLSGSVLILDEKAIFNAGTWGIALNKDTGELIWKTGTQEAGYATPVPFKQDGKQLVLMFAKAAIAGIDVRDGSVVWEFPWQTKYGVNAADPIINGNRIFISSGYNKGGAVIEIQNTKAVEVWNSRIMRNHFNSCILWKGYLYGFDESKLKCIEFDTGKEIWSQGGLGKGSLMLAGETLIILSENGQLVTARPTPDKFDVLSKAKILTGRCWTTPVLSNGRIYARNSKGKMVCVDVRLNQSVSDMSEGKQLDWNQWKGPNRDGVSPEKNLLSQWPKAGPELLWAFTGLGDGYASVSISNDMIYVPGTQDKQGYLYALDMEGNLKWKTGYGKEWVKSFSGSRSTPAIFDGKVYLISGYGVVVCFDCHDGRILWSRDIFSEFKGKYGNWGYAPHPLVYDDKVIFTPGGDKAAIVALNKDDGSIVWKAKGTGEKDAYCPPVIFDHAGRKFLITMMSDSVWFVNPDTGAIIYRDFFKEYQKKPKNINPNTPLYYKGCVYTTSGYDCGGAMYEISKDGTQIKRKWVEENLDPHHGGVVLVDGYLYGANWKGNQDGDWVCIDWETGKTQYAHDWRGKGSIIAAEGMLYCYEEKDGYVGLVKATPEKFDLVSSFQITLGENQHWAHPVICDGRLYIRHGDVLMVYDIRSK